MRPSAAPGLALLLLVACTPDNIRLPDIDIPISRTAPVGDRERGAARFGDRSAGRSGYACVDCHAGPGQAARRPGPPLGGGASARDLRRCIERYLHAFPRDPAAEADLMAYLAGPRPRRPAPAMDPRVLYDQACAGCHERGPAGALLGRSFAAAALDAFVRGEGRAAHPDTGMPPWPGLPIEEREAIVGLLVEAPDRDTREQR